MYRKIVLILLIVLIPLTGIYAWARYDAEIAALQADASDWLNAWLTRQPVRRFLAHAAESVGIRLADRGNRLEASGFIEAPTVSIAAEQSGRIAAITVSEGDRVRAGMALVYLDDALLKAQFKRTQAELAVAEANLSRLEAGARAEEIQKAEALVRQAEAAEAAAYVTWQDAILLRNNQQELDMQINLAQSQIENAAYRVNGAAASKDAAELSMDAQARLTGILQDGVDYAKTLPNGYRVSGHFSFGSGEIEQASNRWNQATNNWWKSWITLDTAALEKEQAEQYLLDLTAMRDDPQSLETQIDQTASNYRAAQSDTEAARVQLQWLEAGATAEQVQAARAKVDQARAKVDTVAAQLGKSVLVAPVDGWVTERAAQPGEMAQPNIPLLTIADLEEASLTIYVPEDEIGRVVIGQPVDVRVDSFPDRIFSGQVSYIAAEAEFTPKPVQTARERVNMVFAVKVDLPNPDHELKGGMPADATLTFGEDER